MKMIRKILNLFKIFLLLISLIFCNPYSDIIELNISSDRLSYRAGENLELNFNFSLKNSYHIYSVNPNISPIGGETYIEYYDSLIFKEIYDMREPIPITSFDVNFNQNTSYHEKNFILTQPFVLSNSLSVDNYNIEGTLYATACIPTQCVRIIEDFSYKINLESGEAREEYKTVFNNINSDLKKETDKGLFPFILFAISMGFIALLTPCVFPMIPITISFFTKLGEKDQNKKIESDDNNQILTPLKAATVYALGIIIIFTLLGFILALTLGASGVQQIAQNPWINLFIGILFIAFAFSLFGYYELQAPQFLTQYTMKQESRSGYTGILFMSLTFTLASFTCTAALVGTLLVAASQGEYFWPIVGMLSFSAAFASPFFLLALFPQYLAKLPKSGGWLNSVKVIMGFLELAAAFKFISNSDLVWNWNIFDREVVLFIWVLILFLISLYLLGFILFPHDTKPKKISTRRKVLFTISLLFCFYLSTGLFKNKIFAGNKLIFKTMSGLVESYLPPPISHSDWIEDLDKAYEISRNKNKPIFLDFTGYTCTNCRWMEINVFEDEEVEKLFEEFILVKLYTDGREAKHKEYRELEINRFNTAALPFYVILNNQDEVVSTFPGYNTNIELFKTFLRDSIKKFKNK